LNILTHHQQTCCRSARQSRNASFQWRKGGKPADSNRTLTNAEKDGRFAFKGNWSLVMGSTVAVKPANSTMAQANSCHEQ
jgi:hypothetical protein